MFGNGITKHYQEQMNYKFIKCLQIQLIKLLCRFLDCIIPQENSSVNVSHPSFKFQFIINLQLFQNHNKMSLFLLPQNQFYSGTFNPQNYEQRYSGTSKLEREPFLFGDKVKNQLKSFKQCSLNKMVFKNSDQTYALKKYDLGFKLKALFSVKSSRINNSMTFLVDVLGPDDNYYQACSSFQAIQICRNIIVEQSCFKQALACIKMNPSTRQIKMQLPLIISYNWPTLAKSRKTNQSVRLVLKQLIQPHLSLISASLRSILQFQLRGQAQDWLFAKSNKNIHKINHYSLISNIATRIPCRPQLQSIIAQRNQDTKSQSIRNLLKNKVAIQTELFKNAGLFFYSVSQNSEPNETIQTLNISNQEKQMKNKISVNMPAYKKLPQNNCLIQNIIYLDNTRPLQRQKIGEGGFAEIYTADFSFWYIRQSDERTSINKNDSNMVTQRLVLKMQLPSTMQMFQQSQQSQQLQKNRKDHEIKIIQKMKKGKSIYLPKYYFPINLHGQKNFHLKNCLLMEYIPFKNLAQLLETNFQCLSLRSKVSLMFSVCQSLRYLRDFDIVHLDLKPNNIMTYYGSYIKLIDFGQSYHHQVCDVGYKPGFTVPYSAPEIFDNQSQFFTSKSDVFSFGVIFYQLLFNKFPFDIAKSKKSSQLDQQMRRYLHYWYYSPEQGQSCGQGEIIRILTRLISKCLQASPQDRPELDWLAVILKLILEIIN